jgi:hypothetical protein
MSFETDLKIGEVSAGPPDSKAEEVRLTSTLHALDHASRLAEIAGEKPWSEPRARRGRSARRYAARMNSPSALLAIP